MIECNFYTPQEVKPLYGEIVPVYQAAFAGEPWYEVNKCADTLRRCAGGLSALVVGQLCERCGNAPSQAAYEPNELVERFEMMATSRPTAWYTERSESGLTLAATAWQAPATTVAAEKYSDVPAMTDWLSAQLGNQPIVWLDEVFANRSLRAAGNLRRFGAMNRGFMQQLGSTTLVFRTINQRMIAAAARDFADQATIFERDTAVPDRRDLVVITRNPGEL